MPTHQSSNGGVTVAGRLAAIIALVLALFACASSPTVNPSATVAPPAATVAALSAVTSPATRSASEDADSAGADANSAGADADSATAATTPPATGSASEDADSARATRHSPPATPLVLSAAGCPAPAETYRNEVMGVELPVAAGRRVVEPQYLFAEYGVALVGAGEEPPFQVAWLYQRTPAQLEALVAEELAQYADLPTTRAPVVVAGVEGVMVWPVPGVVAHTEIYLPVDGRLYRLLYANGTLDDAGRCLLAGLRFFPPTRTLAELHLPVDPGVPAVASPAFPEVTLSADTTTWAEYHNDTYGFSFRYPDGRWTIIEPTAVNPHRLALAYHELGIALRIAVARLGEEADLQLYGGRAGEFVPQGEITFLGEPVGRSALVYEGATWAVYYNDTAPIARGDRLFSLALISNRTIEQGATIPQAVQAEANRIIETFVLDTP